MLENLANVPFTLCVGRLVATSLANWFSPVYCLLRSLGLENRATIGCKPMLEIRLMCSLRYALAYWSHRRWPIGSHRFIVGFARSVWETEQL